MGDYKKRIQVRKRTHAENKQKKLNIWKRILKFFKIIK